DDYFKYGYKSNNFDILNNNYKINYNSFNNKYTKIDRVMDKLYLSYSKMNIYNKCAFRYYLSDILKLDIFEENFSTVIGSMVHYVMEQCLKNNDSDIHKYMMEYLGDREFSKKEKFFLARYEEHLGELLEQVLLEREYYLFNQAMYEERIDIDYGNNIHFVGIIDKILYYIDGDTTYVALIDYKTGNDQISLKYLKYGLDIQLPIYLYLATKLPFKNTIYTGFYLQRFNIKDKDYRLLGYSNSDKEILKVIDKDYDNSSIIKGLKTNKDGSFARYAKVLSNSEIDNLIDKTKDVIDDVISKIKDNEFTINPKVSDGINLGCAYCKFKDICFKDVSDEVTIEAEE
ncbi:MAG: PD-(D/E)XK nuclease family protein, partial [Bacilli bacterium]|nr:PD-(D/E)XK nuclease family protein [Bacilli bacterium]